MRLSNDISLKQADFQCTCGNFYFVFRVPVKAIYQSISCHCKNNIVESSECASEVVIAGCVLLSLKLILMFSLIAELGTMQLKPLLWHYGSLSA